MKAYNILLEAQANTADACLDDDNCKNQEDEDDPMDCFIRELADL